MWSWVNDCIKKSVWQFNRWCQDVAKFRWAHTASSKTLRILTWQLIMDKFGKTGVVPPPEKPELPATRGVVPSPDTEHICSHASAEATQDRVLFCHWEKDGRRGGTLPHKTPPFYSSQIGLQRIKERILWMKNTTLIICYWLYNWTGCVSASP